MQPEVWENARGETIMSLPVFQALHHETVMELLNATSKKQKRHTGNVRARRKHLLSEYSKRVAARKRNSQV